MRNAAAACFGEGTYRIFSDYDLAHNSHMHGGVAMAIMSGRMPRVRMSRAWLVGLLVFQLSCGTILYPERRGQKSGRLDIAVVLLDGLGLLLFVIPGIVAFAVDFATGAIYLPPEESSGEPFQEVRVPPEELTAERLEQILSEHTGKPVKLTPGQLRAMRLQAIEQFTPQTVARVEVDPNASRVRFPGRDE